MILDTRSEADVSVIKQAYYYYQYIFSSSEI